MSGRRLAVVALLVTVLLAGGVSFYASSHPDGLEYVAGSTGFLDSAEDSATSGSPLADYQTEGVDDDRLSGGLAGLLGVGAVLLVAGGLFWALRRRGQHPADDDDASRTDDGADETVGSRRP